MMVNNKTLKYTVVRLS